MPWRVISRTLPPRDADLLLPPDVAFLARIFPVLQSVEAVALARRESPEMPDQQELRRRAFDALRELLRRLGEQAPLILAIDDLQWGDVDSAILLSDLLCSPQSPGLLFIGCFRSEDLDRSPFLSEIRKSIAAAPATLDHRELAVEALTQSEARELALALLDATMPYREPRRTWSAASLAVIRSLSTSSSGISRAASRRITGNESVSSTWTKCSGRGSSGSPKKHSGCWASSRYRAGRSARRWRFKPPSSERAAVWPSPRCGPPGLVRSIGQSQQEEIETYHDRIRETVVAHLSPDSLRWHHERLALVQATAGQVDPEVLAGHLRGSGDLVRACEYYSRGADQAAAALAFDHAAKLYRIALELHQGPDHQARRLWKKLGEALANAGRGSEAAQAYLKSAEGATAAETLELKRLASTQLLISGHVDDGLALLRTLLGPLGMTMPHTARQALASLLWHRSLLRLRGLRFSHA